MGAHFHNIYFPSNFLCHFHVFNFPFIQDLNRDFLSSNQMLSDFKVEKVTSECAERDQFQITHV